MRVIRWSGLLLVIALCSLSVQSALAQASTQTFNLPPKGKATITFQALCIQFGKKFPAGVNGPSSVASDPVQAALSYAQSKGYMASEQQALEVQYTIWQLLNQGGPQGGAITKEVVSQAQNAPAAPQGTSLLDAVKANQVKVTVDSWKPNGQPVQLAPGATDHFYGQGTLTVENTSQQALTLYMPIGTVFPPADQNEQSIAAYATSVQVTSPQPAPQNSSSNLPETSQGMAQALMPLFALLLLGAAVSVRIARQIRM
ncbi:MAG TPA: hypothetical protein VFT66_16325 [Roseiflexaceae bacterium]|nr:hypothetical protein [Roseiflexaceae bacterium]